MGRRHPVRLVRLVVPATLRYDKPEYGPGSVTMSRGLNYNITPPLIRNRR